MPDTYQIQHAAGFALCQALKGKREYRISAMYLEFANVASPGDAVAVPSFTKFDGREYFDALASPADYLRVPVRGEAAVEIADGFEDAFTDGVDGNKLVLTAMSSGLVGMNGLPFTDGANSVVYGVALVCTPDWADRTKDVVFARGYYQAANQVPKRAGRQIGVVWDHTFGEL